MSDSFLKKWFLGSLSLLFLTVSFSFLYGYSFFGGGVAVGGVWNLLNLLLLGQLIPAVLQQDRRPLLLILLFLFLKFPLLYGGGLALLWWVPLSKVGVLIGFSIPLLFVSLQAMAQTRLDAGGLFRLGRIHG
ncbi:MAG: hypothetical protein EPO39_01965 [Candidatus Manganitrophaceae bacterium]|nr:MAG: hypothetical protein EPO39_01965 [Candidatus Manganitrophaceae bacterium]